MVDAGIRERIEQRLGRLRPQDQRRVLEFADALVLSRPRGVPGKEFVKFAGGMRPEDAREMLDAIEEGCEKVDPNGW